MPLKDKTARAAYHKRWRDKNRKHFRAYARERYHFRYRNDPIFREKLRLYAKNRKNYCAGQRKMSKAQREREKLRRRSYYQRNKQKLQAGMREYYLKNKESIKRNVYAWREKNKTKVMAYQKKHYRTASALASDSYLKVCLKRRGFNGQLPAELMAAYKEYLLIKRILRTAA